MKRFGLKGKEILVMTTEFQIIDMQPTLEEHEEARRLWSYRPYMRCFIAVAPYRSEPTQYWIRPTKPRPSKVNKDFTWYELKKVKG